MAQSVNVGQAKAANFDLAHLPATSTQKGNWLFGIAHMFMGGSWIYFVTMVIVLTVDIWQKELALFLLLLVFATAGIVMFLAGFNELFKVTTTTIDKRQITFSSRSLFRSKQWVEDFATYKGILYRIASSSGGKYKPSSTLYRVELFHNDREKVVILHQSSSSKGMRGIWEDSCRKLNLQALEIEGSSLVKRNIDDLDKSVRDLVKEEKISIHFDPSLPPPKGLKVNGAGNMLHVILTKDEISICGALIAILFPGIFIFAGLTNKGGLPFLIIGIIFELVMVHYLLWSTFTRASIRIGEEALVVNRITPWGETTGTTLRASEIESVIVHKSNGYEELLIKTDKQEVAIGRALSAEVLQWLKNCILSIIST
jgi:hypothetical protein